MATGRVPTTANSPLTAKGDLFGYSTAPARLAVGNDGEQIVADSSTSTGLRYQGHIEAGKNFLINGGFDIWQRGTSFVNPAGNSYTTDRWVIYPTAATATVAQETSIVPTGSRYAVKISQATNNATNYFSQAIETANAIRLAGQTITVSGLVAASTSTAVSITVNYSTSVDVAPGGSWTAISATSGGSATPTSSTYVPISGVFAIPSTAKSLFIVFSATITAGNSIYIANTQAEIGSVATNFSRAGGTLQGELAACCYYYERLVSDATYTAFGAGFYTTGSRLFVNVPYQRKRVAPLLAFSNVAGWWGSGSLGAATIATSYIGKTSAGLDVSVSGGSTSTGFGGILSSNNNTAGYIELNSEL